MPKIGLSLFLSSLFLLVGCEKKQQKSAPQPIPIVSAETLSRSVPLYIETVGHIEAYKTVDIMAQASGQLLKVHFDDGADVVAGELLYSIDPSLYLANLKLAQGELAQHIAARGYAKRNAERNAPLVQDDYISIDNFDSLETTVVADDALVEQGVANVEKAEINLGYTSIYAPIDARAGFNLVKEGNLILEDARTTLVTLNQMTPIYASFFIPGKDLSRIQRYQTKESELPVLIFVEDPTLPPYEGRLTFIDNTIDLATGMILLKATLPNKEKKLWPNQYVKVKILLDVIDNAVLVPSAAIQASSKGKFVFVVRANQTVKKQPVVLGQRQPGNWIVVEKGLKRGEHIVIDGQLNLYDGAKVSITDHQRGAM